jgi:hypothetical protein
MVFTWFCFVSVIRECRRVMGLHASCISLMKREKKRFGGMRRERRWWKLKTQGKGSMECCRRRGCVLGTSRVTKGCRVRFKPGWVRVVCVEGLGIGVLELQMGSEWRVSICRVS